MYILWHYVHSMSINGDYMNLSKKQLRPVIPEKLHKPIQRYAVAHSVSTTAAVALLLNMSLRQLRYIDKGEK